MYVGANVTPKSFYAAHGLSALFDIIFKISAIEKKRNLKKVERYTSPLTSFFAERTTTHPIVIH
jgi:hypothetical protein